MDISATNTIFSQIKIFSTSLLLIIANLILAQNLNVELSQQSPTMTICGEAQTFDVSVQKIIDGAVTNITVTPELFRGMSYVPNSYTGDANGDNNNPDRPEITLPDMTGVIGQTLNFTIDLKVGCAILPIGESEVIELDVTANYNGGSNSPPSGPIELQILQPALSIISIDEKTKDAALGTIFTREITFVNGGFGSLSDWVYKSTSGSAIQINNLELYDPVNDIYLPLTYTTVTGVTDTLIANLNSTEITTAAAGSQGNGNAEMELNERITIRETVEVITCVAAESVTTILGEWGCDGEVCDIALDNAFVRYGLVAPDLRASHNTSGPPLCHGVPEERIITIINEGQDIATNVEVDLRTAYGNNYHADAIVTGGFDTSMLSYTINDGATVNLTPTLTLPVDTVHSYYGQFNAPCIRENPDLNVSFITLSLPDMEIGDTLRLSLGVFKCCIDVCGSTNWWGWDYDLRYQDACGVTDLDIDNSTRWTPMTTYYNLDGVSSSPPDVFHEEEFEFQFDFSKNSRRYLSSNSTGYVEIRIGLADEFIFNGGLADLEIVGPGTSSWLADNFSQSGNELIVQYRFPQPFTLTGSYIKMPLIADCYAVNPAGNGGAKNLTISGWVNFDDDAGCSPQCLSYLFCEKVSVTQLHCPGCEEPGMNNIGFTSQRISVGAPDNDSDGFPDATGVLDEDRIRRDRVLEGDTIRNTLTGIVNANGGIGFMGNFSFGYARIGAGRPDLSFVPNSSTVRVYDASNDTYFQCAGLPAVDSIKTSTQSSYTFDYSVPTLSLLGCSYVDNVPVEGGVFEFSHGDSVWVDADIRVCTRFWSGGSAIERLLSSEYYLSYVPYENISSTDDKFSCDNYSSKYFEVSHATTMSGLQSFDFDGCEEIMVSKDFYTYYGGFNGNLYAQNFPGEFRHFTKYDTVKIAFPKEYEIGEAQIWFRVPNGRGSHYENHVIQNQPDDIIIGLEKDTLVFDIKKYYGQPILAGRPPAYGNNGGTSVPGGILREATEAKWMRFYLSVLPTCNTPEEKLEADWFMGYEKNPEQWCGAEDLVRQGFGSEFANNSINQYYDANLRQDYTFDKPQISISSPNSIARPKQSNFTWDIEVFNAPGTTASNAFIYVENNSSGIVVDRIVNATTGVALVDNNNGIFQIGDLSSNSLNYLTIEAHTTNCAPDSLKYYVGWNCSGYPPTIESYPCDALSDNLYVEPESAELQMQIMEAPEQANLCDLIDYEVQLLSAKKGHLFDVYFMFYLPSGVELEGNFEMDYPLGSGYVATADQPENIFGNWYRINLSNQNAILSSSQGFEGVEAPAGSNLNVANVRFSARTNCDFTSGRRVRFFSWADNACGVYNNNQFSPTPYFDIDGLAPTPYRATLLASDIALDACTGTSEPLNIYWRSGAEPTGTVDSIEMVLPYGIGYESNSFSAVTSNATGMSPVVSANASNPDSVEYILKFPIPVGLGSFTELEFTVNLQVLDPDLDCQAYSVDLFSTIGSTAVCSQTNTACTIKSQTAAVNELNVVIEKPVLQISNIDGTVTYNSPMETLNLTMELINYGEDLPAMTTTTVDFYQDLDNNFFFSPGDSYLGSVTTQNAVPASGTMTFSATLDVPAGSSCGLLAVIDPDKNCVCLFAQRFFDDLRLINAGEDYTVCSNVDSQIGLAPVAGYTYEWEEVFPAPITALSDVNISNPNFNYENTTGSQTTFSYILRTLRNGSCLTQDTMSISVEPYTSSSNQYFACPGFPADLHGPAGYTNYQWTPTTGLSDATDPNATISTITTDQVYTLTFDDLNGCPGIYEEDVRIDNTCTDLELTKSVNPTEVNIGEEVTYTISILNRGPGAATGIEVEDILPNQVSPVTGGIVASHGVFNSLQDLWNFQSDTLFANETANLSVTVTINEGLLVTNIAQITAQNETDPDSTPDNDDPNEDDYDYACVTTPVDLCVGDTSVIHGPTDFASYQWQKDGMDISGANLDSLVIFETGVYTLIAFDSENNSYPLCPVNATFKEASIGDYVWLDDNLDGLQTGENAFTATPIKVQLYNEEGVLLAETSTDATGNYLFSNNSNPNQTWFTSQSAVEADGLYYVVLGAGQFNRRVLVIGSDQYSITSTVVNNMPDINNDGQFISSPPFAAFTHLPVASTQIISPDACSFSDVDFGLIHATYDYGDLPDGSAGSDGANYQTTLSTDGPRHFIIPGLHIGEDISPEIDGQESTLASGDSDDGFGLSPDSDLSRGATINLPINITNSTGEIAYLSGWIDWNGDGDFDDAGEFIIQNISDDGNGDFGVNFISVVAPLDAVQDVLIGARFRLSYDNNMQPNGLLNSGEVEDYLIRLRCRTPICLPVGLSVQD